jgi:hypothetical protein
MECGNRPAGHRFADRCDAARSSPGGVWLAAELDQPVVLQSAGEKTPRA